MSGPSSPASSTPPPPVTPPGSSVASSLKAGSSRQIAAKATTSVWSYEISSSKKTSITVPTRSLPSQVASTSSSNTGNVKRPLPSPSSSISAIASSVEFEGYSLKKLTFDGKQNQLFHENCAFPVWENAQTWENIPVLSIISGQNGSGKSQLLLYILTCIQKTQANKLEYIYKSSNMQRVLQLDGSRVRIPIPDLSSQDSEKMIAEVRCKIKISTYLTSSTVSKIAERIIQELGINAARSLLDEKDKKDEKDEKILEYIKLIKIEEIQDSFPDAFSKLHQIFLMENKQRAEHIKSYDSSSNFELWASTYETADYKSKYQIGSETFLDYMKSKNNRNDLFLYIVDQKRPPYWVQINTLFEKHHLDLRMDYQTNFDSPEISFSRKNKPITIKELSSGERLILEMLAWRYYVGLIDSKKPKDWKKLNIILLDEPDRHFDPNYCKLLMVCLNEIANHGTQIIMTTHRTDTLAYAPEGSIFTIKRDDNDRASIEPTSRLNALFRLTPNLREITNFHIKVYTESHDDATFYEKVYTQLLALSEAKRKAAKADPSIPKKEILSRRFQLSFYSLAMSKKGSGGGCDAVTQVVQRDIQALDNLDERFKAASLIERKRSYPLGVIDADTELGQDRKVRESTRLSPTFDKAKTITLAEKEVQKQFEQLFRQQFIFTNRYSLENYVYDPILLFSLLSEEEVGSWFTKDDKFRGYAIACHRAIIAIDHKEGIPRTALKIKILQEKLDLYFVHFLRKFISTYPEMGVADYTKIFGYLNRKITRSTSNTEPKTPILASQLIGKSDLEIKSVLEVLNALDSAHQDKASQGDMRDTIDTAKKALDKLSKKLNGLVNTGAEKKVNVLEKLLEELKIARTGYKIVDVGAIVQGLMQTHALNVEILLADGIQTFTLKYPSFFIYARGHNIEEFIQKTFAKGKDDSKDFQKAIINKIATSPEPLILPMDLVKVIRKLNTRARAQANAVIKPHQLSPLPATSSQAPRSKSKKSNKQSAPVASSSSSSF